MKLLFIFAVAFISIIHLPSGNGGRILFLAPIGSKSHKIFFMGVAEAVAKRGHEVTMVSSFEPAKKIDNIREVVIQNFSLDSLMENIFESDAAVWSVFSSMPRLCLDALGRPNVQALKEEKFDLVIMSMFFGPCFHSIIHHLKVPFIYANPGGMFGSFNDMVGNIEVQAISGCKFFDSSFPLGFKERLAGTLMNEMFRKFNDYYLYPKMHSLCLEKGICSPDTPPFHEFHKNASLAIINSVRTLEYPPRPSMPNIIYAGGAHIKPAKKLPKDLEDWVEGSGEEGFIFFSLGSALNPDFLPERYRKILVKVFGSLKQRVLWKWNQETMENLPKNVKLQKWLPQPDLLGHPKIKLFITHGGLLSTLESTYHGVPIIGMPIFADQDYNMLEVQKQGWGRVIMWPELEENKFRELILEVLNNNKMREIVKRKSVVMKDRPVPPEEEAAYWVEYVMRHKGAPHIRSPVFMMYWYEIYNMDVWAFIIFVIVGTLFVFYLVTKFILRKCCGIGKSKSIKKKRE